LLEKIAFQGHSGERVEVRAGPKHQREQSEGKRGKAPVCVKAHDRAPKSHAAPPGRKVARPSRAGWHDPAPKHSQAVLIGTAVPSDDGAILSCFAIFFP